VYRKGKCHPTTHRISNTRYTRIPCLVGTGLFRQKGAPGPATTTHGFCTTEPLHTHFLYQAQNGTTGTTYCCVCTNSPPNPPGRRGRGEHILQHPYSKKRSTMQPGQKATPCLHHPMPALPAQNNANPQHHSWLWHTTTTPYPPLSNWKKEGPGFSPCCPKLFSSFTGAG